MKRWLVLLLLLLTGCTATPVASDPYARLNLAEQVARDAESAIQATARYNEAEDQLTTAKQTALAAEVYATSAALEHQATAIALEATQQAPALFLQATQVAIFENATKAALQATPLSATAQALESYAMKERALGYIVPVGVAFLFLAAGVTIFLVGLDLGNWLIERDRIRAMRHDSQFGLAVYDYDTGRWALAAQSDRYRKLYNPVQHTPQVRVTPGESTAIGPLRTDPEPLVREFLEAAARVNGTDSKTIPSWRDLAGWTSERWQRAVHYLKSAQVASARPGVGTYLSDDIGTVLYRLDMHELKLDPLPRMDMRAE